MSSGQGSRHSLSGGNRQGKKATAPGVLRHRLREKSGGKEKKYEEYNIIQGVFKVESIATHIFFKRID